MCIRDSPVIGLNSGIILTSGRALNADETNDSDGISYPAGQSGDIDLTALVAPEVTNDAAVLEFDFVSDGGDLYFNYVFASDEYNEFVYQYNDVFGFFVDGENIALVPNSTDYVSIDKVNGGNPYGTNPSNPDYYINNDLDDGGAEPFEYDGFTTVLTAVITGLSAGTHHIKLVVADTGDSALDSAVFIEAGSFTNHNPVWDIQNYSDTLFSGSFSGKLLDLRITEAVSYTHLTLPTN